MKNICTFLLLLFWLALHAQSTPDADLKYTIDHMIRTRDELVAATSDLTEDQWDFKEGEGKWSIAEVVQHLAIWEIVWAREISIGLRNEPNPELNKTSSPDKYYYDFIMEEKPHQSPEFTVPNAVIKGKDALNWFVALRNQNISFTQDIKVDLKSYFEFEGTDYPRNMFQVYIYQWGHIDRHLRQINRIKANKEYPKQRTN